MDSCRFSSSTCGCGHVYQDLQTLREVHALPSLPPQCHSLGFPHTIHTAAPLPPSNVTPQSPEFAPTNQLTIPILISPDSAPHPLPVISITSGGQTHHVLVLSGPSGVHNPLTDLILPTASAFCNTATALASYPAFRGTNCSWHGIFELVQQPKYLWDSYAPHNLGEYGNVCTLWLAWSKGHVLDSVGRLPSLQSIDQRWGSQKNQNHTGRQPAWQPVGNATVCVNHVNNSAIAQPLTYTPRHASAGLFSASS